MINGDIYGDELVVEASPSKNAMIAMKVTLYLRTNVEWNQTLGTSIRRLVGRVVARLLATSHSFWKVRLL